MAIISISMIAMLLMMLLAISGMIESARPALISLIGRRHDLYGSWGAPAQPRRPIEGSGAVSRR